MGLADEPKFPLPGGIAISCTDCGSPKMVYPPSTEYSEILLETCLRNDTRRGFFDCDNCNQRNEYYWHKKHNLESERFTPSVGD
jgi:hypothetical protein